ncbi:MAG TPA: type IX secretion system protein PorQ [Bacteroidales bacterium]|nr:type IX secretion system protein PorQ [Bacteroidales bacterium]
MKQHDVLRYPLFIPLILFLLFPALPQAQTGGNSTFAFLNLVNSARVGAMGGHFLAIDDNDPSLAVYNPSLISPQIHNHLALSFVDYYSDINYGFASYSRTVERYGSFMAAIQFLDHGKFTAADETGQTFGEFAAGEYAVQLGWGRALDSSFSIGSNLKLLYSELENYVASGLAVDVTGTYHNRKSGLTASFLARNIGRQLNTYVPSEPEPLPFELALGVSKRLRHVPLRYSILVTHLERWDLTYDDPADPETDPLTGEPIEENGFEVFADKLMRHFVLGAELTPSRNFSLRLGYNYQRRQDMKVESKLSTVGFSWGFGFRVSRFHFNYARSAWHLAGSPNYITLTTNLSDFIAPER